MNETMRRRGASRVAKGLLDRDTYEALIAAKYGPLALDGRADKFRLHRATVARIQVDKLEPRVGIALAIAAALDTTVEKLWHLPAEVA